MNFTFNSFVNFNVLRIVLLAYKYWSLDGIRVSFSCVNRKSFRSKHKNCGSMHKYTQYSSVQYNSKI